LFLSIVISARPVKKRPTPSLIMIPHPRGNRPSISRAAKLLSVTIFDIIALFESEESKKNGKKLIIYTIWGIKNR
jgi:hypothetical protein